jgi:hypothetical protein
MESIFNTSELKSHKFSGNGQTTTYLPVMVKEKESRCVALFTEREIEAAIERANHHILEEEYNHLFKNYFCECAKENNELLKDFNKQEDKSTIFFKMLGWFRRD